MTDNRVFKGDCIPLEWERQQAFDYPHMYGLKAPRDGNSFFHALLMSYNKVFISGFKDGRAINRTEFINQLRQDLAARIRSKSMRDRRYRTILDFIINRHPRLSIDILADEIADPEQSFRIYWIGIVCEALDIDIYLLDEEKWTVYIYTREEETYFLNPGHRKVVVLLYENNNFGMVGICDEEDDDEDNNDVVESCFDPSCEFISEIRKMMHTNRKLVYEHQNRILRVPPTEPPIQFDQRVGQPPSPPDGTNFSTLS